MYAQVQYINRSIRYFTTYKLLWTRQAAELKQPRYMERICQSQEKAFWWRHYPIPEEKTKLELTVQNLTKRMVDPRAIDTHSWGSSFAQLLVCALNDILLPLAPSHNRPFPLHRRIALVGESSIRDSYRLSTRRKILSSGTVWSLACVKTKFQSIPGNPSLNCTCCNCRAACQTLNKVKNTDREHLQDLFDTYLESYAPLEVNIPDAIRQEIRKQLNDPQPIPPSLFLPAERAIYQVVHTYSALGFWNHRIGHNSS